MTDPLTRDRPAARSARLPARAVRHAVLFVLLLAAGVVVALVVDVPAVGTLRAWLADRGALGWTGLVGGLALATLAPVPRTALSVLAGVLAGFWGGLALALASGVLGAAAGFGLARLLGREAVTRLAGPRLSRADALLSRRGFSAVVAGRLVPVVPFTVVSYAGGLSGIGVRSYLAGSAVGLVPGTVLHVAIGATVGTAGDAGGPGVLVSLLPLAAAGLVVVAVRWWRSRRPPAALPSSPPV